MIIDCFLSMVIAGLLSYVGAIALRRVHRRYKITRRDD